MRKNRNKLFVRVAKFSFKKTFVIGQKFWKCKVKILEIYSADIRSGHRLSIQSAKGRLNVNRSRDSVGAFSYLRLPNRNRSSFDHMPFLKKRK